MDKTFKDNEEIEAWNQLETNIKFLKLRNNPDLSIKFASIEWALFLEARIHLLETEIDNLKKSFEFYKMDHR
ncbi:MAG: hypothetical protein AABX84_01190 [Nanoarchaeota archaeon]